MPLFDPTTHLPGFLHPHQFCPFHFQSTTSPWPDSCYCNSNIWTSVYNHSLDGNILTICGYVHAPERNLPHNENLLVSICSSNNPGNHPSPNKYLNLAELKLHSLWRWIRDREEEVSLSFLCLTVLSPRLLQGNLMTPVSSSHVLIHVSKLKLFSFTLSSPSQTEFPKENDLKHGFVLGLWTFYILVLIYLLSLFCLCFFKDWFIIMRMGFSDSSDSKSERWEV